jgi:hypothetical protein
MSLNFQAGPDGVERGEDSVLALFPVTVERHDKRTFQAGGHFVPGMVDENGYRREWEGSEVFVGTIFLELKDANGNVTDRRQMIRKLADSPQELRRVLSLEVKDSFFAWWHAQQIQSSTFIQFRDANQAGIEFKDWLVAKLPVLEVAEEGGFNAAKLAIEYLLNAVREGTQHVSKLEDRITQLEVLIPWWSRKKVGL